MREEFQNGHWHNRGYLPHYDQEGKYQSITYRLGDSLPFELLNRKLGSPHSNAELSSNHQSHDAKKRVLSESIMDLSLGACTLRERSVAEKKIEAWKHFDGKRYDLISYVVMPNHCHLLIKTYDDWPISSLVSSWKKHVTYFVRKDEELWQKYCNSYYAYKENYLKYNAALSTGRIGKEEKDEYNAALECGAPSRSYKTHFWQREYWDRFIRDENHFNKVIDYIHENPVKAGLAKTASDYNFSSIYNELGDS